jgi:molecular chaperone GrpE
VLVNLLPVLDDIGRARAHGELEGGFKAVAEALEATVDKLGLQAYGARATRSTRSSTRR